jgi:DNA-binding CsgD family transcriptional regulator
MRKQRRYLSTIEVQRELGLSAGQVEELIASRTLPAFRIQGLWRIERKLLDRMIDDLYEEAADAVGPSAPDVAPVVRGAPLTTVPDDTASTTAEDRAVPRIPPSERAIPRAPLTDQQQRILGLVGQGMSNAEIAATLSVEVSTVKSHVSRILQRCAMRDREQLIVLAWRSGLMREHDWYHAPAESGAQPVPPGLTEAELGVMSPVR